MAKFETSKFLAKFFKRFAFFDKRKVKTKSFETALAKLREVS